VLPESSSPSDVAFPVFQEEPQPPRPDLSPPPAAAPAASAWAWADDDDEESDEDSEDDDLVIEDLEDLEILADESEADEPESIPFAGEEKSRQGSVPRSDRASGAASHSPGQPAVPLKQASRELGPDDLDLEIKPESRSSHVALPVVRSRDRSEAAALDDSEDDPDASFSLSRSATQRIEELDLAPMVDVAFQLVLFFMVTATTVLYKTLEIPKPSGDAPASAVAQGRSRSLDDLKDDFILVEIDDQGGMKLDREPIQPVRETLVELLRRAREKTGRKSMLLSADYATLHRNAVLAYDAANEIGLGIAIAKPLAPQGPAPTLRGAPAAPARPAAAAAKPAAAAPAAAPF
jgi:biopolymer transport protein ExbD